LFKRRQVACLFDDRESRVWHEIIHQLMPPNRAEPVIAATKDERWECVDIRAIRPFSKPVTLDMIKSDERLEEMVLVKNSRLSVQPVTPDQWDHICILGKTKT
jgi:predicted RNA-binding protein with PUA-like domain